MQFQVHLLYEEVGAAIVREPEMQMLSNPTVRHVDMRGDTRATHGQQFLVSDLTTGHYVFCAEVTLGDVSLQSQCFTATIERTDGNHPVMF